MASDDRFRGRSVSEGQPTGTLDLSYDATSGLYGGVSVTGVANGGAHFLSAGAYAGYVRPLAVGPSLDVGVTHWTYSEYYGEYGSTQYTEAYVGLITQHFATHVYYSPNYFGSRLSTLYGELDSALHPAPRWRISGHVGLLGITGGLAPPGFSRVQYDWRLGVVRSLGAFDAELAWTGVGPDPDYYDEHARGREGVVFRVSRRF